MQAATMVTLQFAVLDTIIAAAHGMNNSHALSWLEETGQGWVNRVNAAHSARLWLIVAHVSRRDVDGRW